MNSLKIITLSLLLLFSLASYAQDWNTDAYKYDEQYAGYIIDAEGNKKEGFIKYRNRWVMQNEVIFYKLKDNPSTKEKYNTSDLLEYKVGDKLYHCINYSGGAIVETKANLVVNADGCIKEYVWYERAPGYNTLKKHPGESDEDFGNRKYPSTVVFYKEGDDIAVNKAFFEDDFSKKLATYLSDNKVLSKKVKSKENGYNKMLNLKSVFKEYNDNCNK